ncbi:alpha/beta-hydrolase [Pleurotus eryngii]|uniref:Alpha/beta-hydrolase n=1 Tax=Pleurotus eryngii TaxID=5323 RepID=A0A9P6DF59_PLEER|nr:alpha/beta-hydrolase [Pleurotus eryngii]
MTSLCLLSWFTFIIADLVFYFQYASSVYNDVCAQPNGNTLVQRINRLLTDTQGFIEIVVALPASTSPSDLLLDNELFLVPFLIQGWNSTAPQVISTVRPQPNAYPGYSLVTTGHSLGGSLSGLAAISLKQNFPKVMYTYGQPRTFNAVSAQFINSQFGTNAFRFFGAASSISTVLGYRHHGVEYWQNPDPATSDNVKQCSTTNGEDPTCSASIPFLGIGPSHLTYYRIAAGTPFC